MEVWRPCDTVETAVAWAAALRRKNGPTALLLTRQNVPFVKRAIAAKDIAKGGYVLADAPEPKAVLIATGSEVSARAGGAEAACRGGDPGAGGVDALDQRIRPPGRRVPELGAAARDSQRWRSRRASATIWRKYVGLEGAVVGIDRYGESAPAADLFKHFGFTPENVAKAVRSILQ